MSCNGQGFIKAMVKVAKNLLKKNEDPYLALLQYRNSPLHIGYSPAQLLMGRRLRSSSPIYPALLDPKTVENSTLRLKEEAHRAQQKANFDSRHNAKDREDLKPGDPVWLTDMNVHGVIDRPADTPR